MYPSHNQWLTALVILALVLGSVVVPVSSTGSIAEAAATDVGYRDFSFGTGVSSPTAEKPQSKLWFNDGLWWGSLYNASAGEYRIFRMDWGTQTWSDTGTRIDEREVARMDVLWDGKYLYVGTAGTSSTNTAHNARILRYSYSAATKSYSLDTGFPVTIVTGGMDALVIDKDSTGKVWATYVRGPNVYVTHSTTDDRTWLTPYVIPVSGASNLLDATDGDMSAIVAFDTATAEPKIGVMWSNQNEHAMYFATHADGRPDSEWQVEPAVQAPEYADDHLNIKSLQTDASGRVFAATKTSLNASDAPLVLLLVKGTNGGWSRHTFGRVADDHTRPIVLIDQENRNLYLFAASPCCSGGIIYYKQTSLDNINFPTGKGTPLIQSSTDTTINNPTSTKQTLKGATGLVVMASDNVSDHYLHGSIPFNSGPDTTAPNTTISSGPQGTVTTRDATFEFSSSESGSMFECTLDGAAFTACTSPKAYTGLADGSHTFQVRATDTAGNTDATPATRTWTIDTSMSTSTFSVQADAHVDEANPSINYGTATGLVIDGGAAVTNQAYLKFAVSGVAGAVRSAKLRIYAYNGTANGPVVYGTSNTWSETGITWSNKPASVGSATDNKGTVSSGTWTEYDVTPVVTGDGTYSFVFVPESTDGLDVYSRESTNTNKPQLVVSWQSSDTTAPETSIDSGPSGSVNATSASFSFSSTEAGSSFECKLDGGAYAACASPKEYTGLGDGPHTFVVRAKDAAGNVDTTPATREWTIDATAPETVIDSGPSGAVSSASASFSFSSSEAGSSFECSLDGAAFSACTSPKTYTGLAEGSHNFKVRSVDAVGNADSTPASRTWTVDTVAPETSVDTTPVDPSRDISPTFAFSSDDTGATFECKLDAAAFAGCTSPLAYTGLTDGSHTFEVRAKDAVGNMDATPAAYTWTVDTRAPEAPAITSPADNSYNNTGSVTVSGTAEPRSTVEVFEGATSKGTATTAEDGKWSKSLANVVEGSHTYTAKAMDVAGNTSPASNSRTVIVDTVVPDTIIDSGPSGTVNSAGASFTFSSNESRVSFECSLDGASYGACASPKEYTGLSDGAHTFDVRAKDVAGNMDSTPARRSWTVDTTVADTTAPDTTITSGPSGSVDGMSAAFGFSSSEAGSTFECSLDGTAFTACTSPAAYTGLSEGSHTFEVRATDAAKNTDAAPASRTWTVDVTAPDTTIVSGPTGTVNTGSAELTFSSTEAGSTFECSLDDAAYAACTSPKEYTGLADGSHTFQVHAIDAAGNADASPATRTWTIDATAPSVSSVSPANSAVNVPVGANVTAVFSEGMDPATLTSATFTLVKEGSTTGVTSTVTYDAATKTATLDPNAELEYGSSYTATVQGGSGGAKDVAGNALAADKSWSFSTARPPDTAPPTVSLTSPADASTVSGDVTLSADASDNVAVDHVDFLVDGKVVGTDTTSPYSVTWDSKANSDGPATITARAVDSSENSASSDARIATVANPPETTLDSGPTGTVNTSSASFSFSSSETPSTFECKLDEGLYVPCTSPHEYTALAEGEHTFEVRAIDSTLNTDATPAGRTWTMDTTAPAAPAVTSPENNSYNNTGSVTISGTAEANSTVEIFEGTTSRGTDVAAADGGWSKTLTSVANGSYMYSAKATDAAGNTSSASNSVKVTVDTVDPSVSSVSPADGAMDVALEAKISATFSEQINADTLTTSTFTLVKEGTTTPVEATVTYDPATHKVMLAPATLLTEVTTYTATVKTAVKDLAGNGLAANKVWTFTTADVSAPPVSITEPADGASVTGNVKYSATASDNIGVTEVRFYVDDKLLATDSSAPYTVTWNTRKFTKTTHVLRVDAIDAAGNVGRSQTITVTVR